MTLQKSIVLCDELAVGAAVAGNQEIVSCTCAMPISSTFQLPQLCSHRLGSPDEASHFRVNSVTIAVPLVDARIRMERPQRVHCCRRQIPQRFWDVVNVGCEIPNAGRAEFALRDCGVSSRRLCHVHRMERSCNHAAANIAHRPGSPAAPALETLRF